MAKYNGSALYVEWIYSGGTVNLTADSREFEWNKEAARIDTTTRGDATRTSLGDFPAITASLTSLDTVGTAQAWENLDTDQEGTIRWGPEGTASGKRKRELPAVVSSVNFKSPYNNAVEVSLSWEGNGAITKSTY